MSAVAAPAKPASVTVPLTSIFMAFLLIGATSFGGGVVAYLRGSLVKKHEWVTDVEFLELMSISNTLPGLNATNMSILVGNRLRGALGASVALLGMCLPGFALMTLAAVLYGDHGDRPLVSAMLRGSAAAAVGMIAATWYQLGRKSVRDFFDAIIIVAAVLAVNLFKLTVPEVMLGAGAIAIFHHRPGAKPHHETEARWISSLQ